MTRFAEVLILCGVERDELAAWIERRWVLPLATDGDYVFSEVDIARVWMIRELHRDFNIDEDAMALVLGLVDQLYAARRRLRQIIDALAMLPDDQREAVLRRLEGISGDDAHMPS